MKQKKLYSYTNLYPCQTHVLIVALDIYVKMLPDSTDLVAHSYSIQKFYFSSYSTVKQNSIVFTVFSKKLKSNKTITCSPLELRSVAN